MHEGGRMAQRLMWILWPSFLMASVGVGVLFSLVDPHDIHFFGEPVEVSRMTAYSIGFFAFWVLGSVSSWLTCTLAKSPFEVNRCTVEPQERPAGCPKRPDEPCCD
jgi:hypothetical protein